MAAAPSSEHYSFVFKPVSMSDSPVEKMLASDLEGGGVVVNTDGPGDAEKSSTAAPLGINSTTVETAPADDATNDDVDYDALLSEEEKKEDAFIAETIEAEEDKIVEEGHEFGEVLQGDYTDDKKKQMRSLFVKDKQGKIVHKRTLLADVNKGVSLSKSTDRTKRVRGDPKYGGGRKKDNGTSVMRAFSHHEGGPNSGDDRHCHGDFCCVMVASTNNLQHPHMVIGKFLRFGESSCRAPLELAWPLERENFNASILVCRVKTYVDVASELCLCADGNNILTLQCVQSSCFTPIVANLEEFAEEDGTFTTTAVMKISDLTSVFEQLSKGNRHNLKNTTSLPPIEVNGTNPFVVMPSTDSTHLPVCRLCQPPMRIGKVKDDSNAIQRALRNHAASHLLTKTSIVGEPCGLCCSTACTLRVDVRLANVRTILDNDYETAPEIEAKSMVEINCDTFPDTPPFKYNFCKDVAGYPSTNKPVLCRDCSSPGSELFIWSYNIENHYKKHHTGFSESDAKKYSRYCMKTSEKDNIIKKFPINPAN